jgi:hypothetical protein
VDLRIELHVHGPFDDEQELLGIAVRVRLVTGRASRLELGGDHLERVEGLRREQRLAAEVPPDDGLAGLAAQHARTRHAVGREEVRHFDAECRRDPLQRCDTRVRPTALDLADEALAHAGRVGDLPQRPPPEEPDRPQPLADGGFSRLNRPFTQVKRAYACRAEKDNGRRQPPCLDSLW